MTTPKDEHATSTIVLRVTPSRKSAYVRAAHPRTLSAWMFEQCDRAAGVGPRNEMADALFRKWVKTLDGDMRKKIEGAGFA